MSTQSLPSFAQAFSNRSLSSISKTNALPPIMPATRKRSQEDDADDDVRVKQELHDPDTDGAPAPSSLMPSQKKRRVTVSGGAPHPLHIDVRPPHDHQASSTPISPVVMGFTLQRDNPTAIEQVRNMINVKQKQKALIEQRRDSAAGLMSPIGNPPHTPIDDRPPPQNPIPITAAGPAPRTRRSPNNGAAARRPNNTPQRPPSPPPPTQHVQQLQQQQQPQQQQQQPAPAPAPQHSLPPPPISFARRRAALLGGKKKPADIVISPREAHTRDQFQPSIQSAPPIPQAGGQNQFYTGRGAFQMAIPRLPTITGSENPRRVAGNVPPTPTRLALMQQAQQAGMAQAISHTATTANAHPLGLHAPAPPNRSPPASIPIASTLVPPTPTSLHRPGYQGDKAAFLAPFEVFYDALADSKQLKTWLGDQLKESRQLIQTLAAQQERMHEAVDGLVEKKVKGLRAEVGALRGRVAELEEILARPASHQGRANGLPPPVASEAYTFPPAPHPSASENAAASSSSSSSQGQQLQTPVSSRLRPDLVRKLSASPGWGGEQQQREGPARPRSDNGGASPRVPPPLSRQNSGVSVPMVVVSDERDRERDSGRERERDRGDRERGGYHERDLRDRGREREREYEGRERDSRDNRDRENRDREYAPSSRRGSVSMDAVEDEQS